MKIFYSLAKQLLFMSLLSACGEAPHIEPEAQPYIDRFVTEAKIRNVVVNIQFLTIIFTDEVKMTPQGYQFGYCEEGVITLVKSYFLAQTDVNKEVVLFHELGHCILKREHVDGVSELKIPESLMIVDPTLVTSYYEQNRNFYLNELFSREKSYVAN